MATNLEYSITLEPVGYRSNWPEFYIKLDNDLQESGTLEKITTYDFNVVLEDGDHVISVGFTNKTDTDTQVVDDKIVADKAIIIKSITIEGYTLDNFVYKGIYYPTGRWHSTSSYLSWNGNWQLAISTPIFTWIHKTQHLGWIYEKNL